MLGQAAQIMPERVQLIGKVVQDVTAARLIFMLGGMIT